MKHVMRFLILSLFAVGSLAMPAYAADKPSGKDREFATKAALGGLMEVQLGKLAQEKAQTPEVKNFGQRMVEDHGKANDELKQLASKKNLRLPTALDEKHQKKVDKLQKASGADFDQGYMREMVKDHSKDVAQFRKASTEVKDPDLRAWAEKTLPVLEEHLRLAKETAQKAGVEVSKAEEEGRQEAEKKK